MSCLQIASFRPQVDVNVKVKHHDGRVLPSMTCIYAVQVPTIPITYLKLSMHVLKYQWHSPTCLFGGKEKSESNNQDPPWKGLKKALGNIGQKQSVEDVLRQQIEKQEYYNEEAGGGGSPGGGGGPGGGDSGGDGSADFGEPEEESLAEKLDEALQVTLATLGLIFMYVYILHGPEITVLAKDFIRYLFTRKKSIRLKKAMHVCGSLWQRLTRKQKREVVVDDDMWLQREILNTRTWWDSPSKYRHIMSSYLASRASDEIDS